MSFTASLAEIVANNVSGLLGSRPSWSRVSLGEICSIQNGAPFPSDRFSTSEGTPLVRIRDLVRGKTETYFNGSFDPQYLVDRADLLVGMDGDFNCTLWPGEPALLNQRVCKITPDERRITRRFLRYVLPGYLSAINAHTSAITVKHLSSRTLAEVPLPVPPLDEQLRLTGYLDEQLSRLDASVAALHRAQANLKRYRASVFEAACEGRLVPTETGLVHTGLTGDHPKTLAELPSTWSWKKLGELIQDGPKNGLYVPKSSYGSGTPIIRISDYQNGWSRPLAELQRVAISSDVTAEYCVCERDLLINRVNSLTHLGKVLLVNDAGGEAVFESNMMRLRLSAIATPEYVVLYLQSREGRARLVKGAKWAVNQASINQKDVRDCLVPVPPLAEQHRIVAEADRRLSLIRAVEQQIASNLVRAQRLRQSILQAAFSLPESPLPS